MQKLNEVWSVLKSAWNSSEGMVGRVIGIILGLILILNVLLPSTKESVTQAQLTGTDALIAGFFTTFEVIAALMLIYKGLIGGGD